jgi:hypothetical protein
MILNERSLSRKRITCGKILREIVYRAVPDKSNKNWGNPQDSPIVQTTPPPTFCSHYKVPQRHDKKNRLNIIVRRHLLIRDLRGHTGYNRHQNPELHI